MGRKKQPEKVVREWIPLQGSGALLAPAVRTALEMLRMPGEDEVALRVAFNNLALAHAANIHYQETFGKWAKAADQLTALAETADALVAQLRDLTEGARSLLADVGNAPGGEAFQAGDPGGVMSELMTLPPGVHADGSKVDGVEEPASWTLNLTRVRPVPPRWPARAQALAGACREAAVRAQANARRRGRRTIASDSFGPPELQLLVACGRSLHDRGREVSRAYDLARAIHKVVTGETPTKAWASEAHRRWIAWWKQVGPWVGREAEASSDLQELLREGPRAHRKRQSSNRP